MIRWQIEPMPHWPYPEAKQRRGSTFGASWSATLDLLDRELDMLAVRGVPALRVVASDADVRQDGMLRATARLSHPGVALSFESARHGALTYPCDTFVASGGSLSSWQANVRAIALGLEALRKLDRYGIAGRGEQYAGWRAIESPTSRPTFASVADARQWLRDLTGSSMEFDNGVLLRRGAREAHPDRNGGDRVLWDRYDAARQLLEGGTS